METCLRKHHGFISKITIPPPLLPKCYESFFFPICLLLLAFPLFALAEEQAQQRLQAEKAEKQYQTVLRQLNATTRKTQKKE